MATESLICAWQWKGKIKFKAECLLSALFFKTSTPDQPPPRILVLCLCKTSTEEMTSLRKIDVSFTCGQQNVLVRPTRTPRTFFSISCPWPGFLSVAEVQIGDYRVWGETWSFVRCELKSETIFMCPLQELYGDAWRTWRFCVPAYARIVDLGTRKRRSPVCVVTRKVTLLQFHAHFTNEQHN